MILSRKQKNFSHFVSAFLEFILNFEHFQKNMTLTVDAFPKLRTPKNVVNQIPEKSTFRESFNKQHGKRSTNF